MANTRIMLMSLKYCIFDVIEFIDVYFIEKPSINMTAPSWLPSFSPLVSSS